jgi:hypothetical protein
MNDEEVYNAWRSSSRIEVMVFGRNNPIWREGYIAGLTYLTIRKEFQAEIRTIDSMTIGLTTKDFYRIRAKEQS